MSSSDTIVIKLTTMQIQKYKFLPLSEYFNSTYEYTIDLLSTLHLKTGSKRIKILPNSLTKVTVQPFNPIQNPVSCCGVKKKQTVTQDTVLFWTIDTISDFRKLTIRCATFSLYLEHKGKKSWNVQFLVIFLWFAIKSRTQNHPLQTRLSLRFAKLSRFFIRWKSFA